MRLRELYQIGEAELDEAGIESPCVDAFYLLEAATGLSRSEYLLYAANEVKPEISEKYLDLIAERGSHVPYQYITKEADFMGLKIHVTPDVLIPRLDTEVLVDEASRIIPKGGEVLDMCTGSGCMALALKSLRKDVNVCAGDISEAALDVAIGNAAANGLEVTFARGDLFEAFAGRSFDCIMSNPPYVTEREYMELTPEVKDHEPKLALTAGEDGLDIYRRLVPEAREHLKPEGVLIMEMGCFQGEAIKTLMEENGYKNIKIIKDLAGLDRIICGRL